MLLWQSFDDLEKKREDNIRQQADMLKQRTIELEAVKENAKKAGYAEALDKATEDFLLKKENAVKELTDENAQQIKHIQSLIENSVVEQSQHYSKLLIGIIEHFIPQLCENKGYEKISETLTLILEGCDKRYLVVTANNKTLARFTQLISCQTRRIELMEQDDLKEGMIKVRYEGGGADIDIHEYQDKAIKSLTKMLGQPFVQQNKAHSIEDLETSTQSKATEKNEDAKEATVLGNEVNISESAMQKSDCNEPATKPLFEEFAEETTTDKENKED